MYCTSTYVLYLVYHTVYFRFGRVIDDFNYDTDED
jgi:hypothetical protein